MSPESLTRTSQHYVQRNCLTDVKGEDDMMIGNKRRWTPSEDETLTYGYVHGTPIESLATELGRTKRSVTGRAHGLGLLHKNFGKDYLIHLIPSSTVT